MAWNIHGNYHEDNYNKYECQICKRCFIVGEKLSEGASLTCPYCRSSHIEMVAASSDDSVEDMDLGCLGIYYHLYENGQLMLFTEQEFARAMKQVLARAETGGIPLSDVNKVINCAVNPLPSDMGI